MRLGAKTALLAAALGAIAAAANAANTIGCWKMIASQPCVRYIVGDTEAGLPSTGVPEGFTAWPKDTDRLVCYYGGSWQPCNSGGGGGLSDGDKGDVTVSGSGATWTIDADSVALGTDTTGNYAGSSTEGGAATSAADLTCTNCISGTEIDESGLGTVPTATSATTAGSATTAATATALAADPADCSATQFATAIAASGALFCAALTDADVPNTITVSLAATASALAANPTACGAGDFVTDIAADGTLSCSTPSGGLTHPQVMARLAIGGAY